MKINYVFEGHGDKTIVFVHGLMDSLEYWRRLSSSLNDEYRTLIYDIRGHGDSPLGDDAFNIDTLVDDLYNLFLKLGIEKASLVGLSMGGNIVLSFAIRYPDLVDKIVLMSTYSETDDNLESILLEFKQAISISYEAFFDVIIRYVIPEKVYDQNKDALEILKREKAKKANIDSIKNGIDVGLDFNVTQDLNKIDCPALILAGRDDDIISLELCNILKSNIKNSDLIIFENTKHDVLFGRNLLEVSELLGRFF